MSDNEQMTEEILEIAESDSDEIRNLKRMVLTFKKRYQRAMQHSSGQEKDEETKALIEQQTLLKEMLQKVQRESEEKIIKTRNDLQVAQENLRKLSETTSELKIENQALKDSQLEILSTREKEDVAFEMTSEDSSQKLASLQKENFNLKEQQGQLKEFLSEAQEEFVQIKEELVKTRQRLETSEKTVLEMEIQNESLRCQQREQEEIRISEISAIQQQMEVLKEHLATTQEENNLFRMRADKANTALEKSREELEQARGTGENLERYKDHLTAALEENNHLKSELSTFEEVAKLAQQEAIHKTKELDESLLKLQTAFEVTEEMQREVQILSQENEAQRRGIEEKEELVEELEMIKGQFGKLKDEITANRQKIREADKMSEMADKAVNELENDKHKLEVELAEKSEKVEELDKELFTMKQTLVQGLREAKEFKDHYQRAAGERTSMIQKNIRVQQQMHQLKEELVKKENELQEVLSQVDSQRGFEEALREKEEEIATLSSRIQAGESELNQVKSMIDEKEQHIKQAQQHMAKKVKEASELNDLVTQQRSHIERLEDEMQGAQQVKSEAKTSMESFVKQEKLLQDQIKNWEEKYFHIYDQWKELEVQNKELKKLEDKYQQMQDFLSNFGSFGGFNEKQMPHTPAPKAVKKPLPKKEEIVNEMDLFSMKPSSNSPKDNFFE